MAINHLDLFCGAGGFRQALSLLSIPVRTLMAQDIEKTARQTYAHNHPGHEVLGGDVRSLSFDHLLGDVDLLTAGSPCNDFSIVGERRMMDGRYGNLIEDVVRITREVQPRLVVFENVMGIATAKAGHGKTPIQRLTEMFQDIGYDCMWRPVNFSYLGVPQARKRIILVAEPATISPQYLPHFRPHDLYSINPLPCREVFETPLPKDDIFAIPQTPQETIFLRMQWIQPGRNIWHAMADGMPESLGIRTRTRLSNLYRRLDLDAPAHTITAVSGGGQAPIHPTEHRFITPREGARIQSYPDTYVFAGTAKQVWKQIGMSVPPVGMASLLRQLLDQKRR